MLKKILLPVIFVILGYGFWVSPNVKEIAAGVSIFLFGMLFLEEGFKAFTGGLLEKLLKKTTDRQWKAVLFGIVSTTIMQSSSLVSVITISFLSAGLIWLASGIGIIFGANIGTTTGAWLVAGFGLKVKISAYAMPMLVFGIILVFQSQKALKGIGYILAGLGFLFLGIHHMKEGFEVFRETIDLAEYAMSGFLGLIVFTLMGTVATVIMQSSHATLVLIITALAAGQITYENALALAIGANIGTTITAIIGSMSSNYQGKRLAAAHLIFNGVTGAIAIAFIHQIVWMVDAVSVRVGIAADDYTLKLAVFHTIFNIIGVGVMWPLTGWLVNFLQRVIPKPKVETAEPRFITDTAFGFPETLLNAVRQETQHLYGNALEVMSRGLALDRTVIQSNGDLEAHVQASVKPDEYDMEKAYVGTVKSLYAAILEFISKAHNEIPAEFGSRLYELRDACHGIVFSVKGIAHLRTNTLEHIRSDNDDVRQQYNFIRNQIAGIMRTIHELGQMDDEERDVLVLDEFKVTIDEDNLLFKNAMDDMIRDGKLPPLVATSLMNDLGYAKTVIWHLADMGKALYGAHDAIEKEVEDVLSLTEEDVDGLRSDAA